MGEASCVLRSAPVIYPEQALIKLRHIWDIKSLIWTENRRIIKKVEEILPRIALINPTAVFVFSVKLISRSKTLAFSLIYSYTHTTFKNLSSLNSFLKQDHSVLIHSPSWHRQCFWSNSESHWGPGLSGSHYFLKYQRKKVMQWTGLDSVKSHTLMVC